MSKDPSPQKPRHLCTHLLYHKWGRGATQKGGAYATTEKRSDSRYETKIYLGRDEADNKPRYKSIYADSLSELKAKETELRHQLGKGLDVLSQRDAFSTWADDWFRIKDTSGISDKQLANYRHAVEVWKREFSSLEIGAVRADDIERVLVRLQQEGYARRTIELYRATIRQIMKRATGRVIAVNPESMIELTKGGKEPETRRALTDEEQQWIWETPGKGQRVAVIMMLSGLRRGELAALTWNDVDLKNRTITVNKTIEYLSDRTPRVKSFTKSAAGMRVVDIPKKLADYMAGLERDSLLVVHTAAGGVMTESAWVKLWNSYMRELNIKYGSGILKDPPAPGKPAKPGPKTYEMTIPRITLHWLRHTFCTIMYLAGVDVVTASKQMGHADVATTLRIYTHLDNIYKRKAVDKLDKYLKARK